MESDRGGVCLFLIVHILTHSKLRRCLRPIVKICSYGSRTVPFNEENEGWGLTENICNPAPPPPHRNRHYH